MAETKQEENEPASTAPNDQSQPQQQNNNRDQDVLSEVVELLTNPLPENADSSALSNENQQLRSVLTKMTAITREKATSCLTLQKKIEALNMQVSSLKEIVSITKEMLSVRNMEVKHLHTDMDSIQGKMELERKTRNEMVNKLDAAMKLNEQLKTEYGVQLKLFQTLKEKYEQRAVLMEAIHNNKTSSSESNA